MSIDIENIRKRFGNAEVLSDINLKIASGEMIALLGPSGSGKTTLLRILAGLETETGGRIRFGTSDVTQLTAAERRVGVCLSELRAFPPYDGCRKRGIRTDGEASQRAAAESRN